MNEHNNTGIEDLFGESNHSYIPDCCKCNITNHGKREILDRMYIYVVREILELKDVNWNKETANELVEQIRNNVSSGKEEEYDEYAAQEVNDFTECWFNYIIAEIVNMMKKYSVLSLDSANTFEQITKERIEKLISRSSYNLLEQYYILVFLEKIYAT